MKIRTKKYEDISPVEFLILRESLGMRRYRKKGKRSDEEKKYFYFWGLKRWKRQKKTILFL